MPKHREAQPSARGSRVLVLFVVSAMIIPTLACQNRSKLDDLGQDARQTQPLQPKNEVSLAPIASTVRVGCMTSKDQFRSIGSAFSHVSGVVISCAHVVALCPRQQDIALIDSANNGVAIQAIKTDAEHDLAIFYPARRIGAGLHLSSNPPQVGSRLAAWGWPHGYDGAQPLLSVGYYAGFGKGSKSQKTSGFPMLWVDIAVTHGNSGGPVLIPDSDEVVGVLDMGASPQAPPLVEGAFDALLKNSKSEVIYSGSNADGPFAYNEAQTIAVVVDWMRKQIHLGFGAAVPAHDVAEFLRKIQIDP